MNQPRASIIIPTHNRHDDLVETLARLQCQNLPQEAYEILVMDDGSTPPVILDSAPANCRVIRLEGIERSAARNTGARLSQGKILLFLDDDIHVKEDFLAVHLQAHAEWPRALVVGAIYLPAASLQTPFGKFRHQLEQAEVPRKRGLVKEPNFCTAANMSIDRESYFELGGFNSALCSAEDQELAMRHTARGGQIVFVPEAEATHYDKSLDIQSYCRRVEWGNTNVISFTHAWPEWSQNINRHRVNGALQLGQEPLGVSLRKTLKAILGQQLLLQCLFQLTLLLERRLPQHVMLDCLYRLLLGIHLQRGYRKGLQQFAERESHQPDMSSVRRVN